MSQTSETQLKNAEACLAEALASRETKDVESAVKQLRELLEVETGFVRGWMELGKTLRQIGEHGQALKAFETAESLDPSYLPSQIEIAVSFRYTENVTQAVKKLDLVLSKHKEQADALFQLGEIYKQKKDYKRAIESYERTIKAKPEHPWASIQISSIYQILGDWKEAERQLQCFLKRRPNSFSAYIHLGLIKHQQGELESALDWFQRAKRKTEVLALQQQALRHIAEELKDLNRLADACKVAEALVRDNPRSLEYQLLLARIYHCQHKFQTAVDIYQRVLSKHPKHIQSSLQLTYSLCELRKSEMALDILEKLLQSSDKTINHLPVQLRKSEILHSLGFFNEVEKFLHGLEKDNPNAAEVLIQLGRFYRFRGELSRALAFFRQAEKFSHTANQVLSAQFQFIETLRELNRLEEAKVKIKKILRQRPFHERANMILAGIYYLQLDLKLALSTYKKILKFNQNSIGVKVEISRILSETGRETEAETLLMRLPHSQREDLRVLMRLGQLAQAKNDWVSARSWYEISIKKHPYKYLGYVGLAEVLYKQENFESAFQLLVEAEEKITLAPEIYLKRASFLQRLGYPEGCEKVLNAAQIKFPMCSKIIIHKCQLYIQLGWFDEIRNLLNKYKFYDSYWYRETEKIKGEIALRQFQFEEAEQSFSRVVQCKPAEPRDYKRLAQSLMMQVKLEEALCQLRAGTKELMLRKVAGDINTPLKSNEASVLNYLRLNPELITRIKQSQEEIGLNRCRHLASILIEEPAYTGTSIYCMTELFRQEILMKLRDAFSPTSQEICQDTKFEKIPRRIIQYWNSSEPPFSIQEIMSSWLKHNPSYEYVCFSYESALEFLDEFYEETVLQAFQCCRQPATQADLFRLLYLSKMGGVYADADDRCLRSLEPLIESNAELLLYREEYALGNNFIGCVPNQKSISLAASKAIENSLEYSAESSWFKTGPGLLTSTVCESLSSYLSCSDYRVWPRINILSLEESREYVWSHVALPYKETRRSWNKAHDYSK